MGYLCACLNLFNNIQDVMGTKTCTPFITSDLDPCFLHACVIPLSLY